MERWLRIFFIEYSGPGRFQRRLDWGFLWESGAYHRRHYSLGKDEIVPIEEKEMLMEDFKEI